MSASTRCWAPSSGLVTDYSSVWVDYLLVDRPMAFLVPDRDSYTRQLLPPDVLDWAPGELVGPDEPFVEFLADLDSDGRAGAAQRAEVATKIGLNPTHTSADDLLDELAARSPQNGCARQLDQHDGFRRPAYGAGAPRSTVGWRRSWGTSWGSISCLDGSSSC